MTLIERSLAIIDQRGEIAKRNLKNRIACRIIDETVAELKKEILTLLVIKKVRLN